MENDTASIEAEGQPIEEVVEIPVHPYAAAFPMMDDEELNNLAADILANGQHHPIVFDKSGQLLDGRNRLKACKLAKVEPTTTTTELDPITYIIAANVKRRHLSKSQIAMAYAMAYPDAIDKGGRGKTSTKNVGVSDTYISNARYVFLHSKRLAAEVMAGNADVTAPRMSLPNAYDLVVSAKREEEAYERLRNEVCDQLDSIIGVCVKLKSSVFEDQDAFMKEVHAEAAQIIEVGTQLKEL
jgi:hypothetical protein